VAEARTAEKIEVEDWVSSCCTYGHLKTESCEEALIVSFSTFNSCAAACSVWGPPPPEDSKLSASTSSNYQFRSPASPEPNCFTPPCQQKICRWLPSWVVGPPGKNDLSKPGIERSSELASATPLFFTPRPFPAPVFRRLGRPLPIRRLSTFHGLEHFARAHHRICWRPCCTHGQPGGAEVLGTATRASLPTVLRIFAAGRLPTVLTEPTFLAERRGKRERRKRTANPVLRERLRTPTRAFSFEMARAFGLICASTAFEMAKNRCPAWNSGGPGRLFCCGPFAVLMLDLPWHRPPAD